MVNNYYILLAEVDEFFKILPLLVFVAIGVIGKILQKAAKRAQEQEQQKKAQPEAQKRRAPRRLTEAPAVRRPPRQTVAAQLRERIKRPQQKVAPAEPAVLGVGVRDADLHRVQQLRQKQQLRQRRLSELEMDEAETKADTEAIVSRLVSIAPAAKTPSAEEAATDMAVGLNLRDADALRRAIIYHEIFSAPKAMRQEREIWEL